jgi:hypothetical protein
MTDDELIDRGLLPNPNSYAVGGLIGSYREEIPDLVHHYERVMHEMTRTLSSKTARIDGLEANVDVQIRMRNHAWLALRWLAENYDLDEQALRVISHAVGEDL